jgi:dienelactone hydrolase
MIRRLCLVNLTLALAGAAWAADPPSDRRTESYKTLNSYFPFQPPKAAPAWEARKQELRRQLLVALGLWPMPEKIPLRAVVHGKIDRDGYTIEKVFFASYPGHYVCGSLYRPKGKSGKLPGVLCPHGHWQNGRFYDAGEANAQKLIKHGDEKTVAGARYPLQARCANLAMMGCIVFHYDMVGVADSAKQFAHTVGFRDAEAELRQQNFMGLQTFNSIRALDFLLSLPDVDSRRIGVTGASGGGTQTFILCAIDDRPTVAFPAVMVSTAMQGGCICENCSYLRQGTGNVEIAGLFAPKALAMTGANDWTVDIETKGLPELKALYNLYGAEDRVMAKCFKQFDHNYNQVSREVMYNWFNKHLGLGQKTPVTERPFIPVPPAELSVFDKDHPLPGDAANPEKLRKYLTQAADAQLAALRPTDDKHLATLREVVGPALRVMIHDRLPAARDVAFTSAKAVEIRDNAHFLQGVMQRKGTREAIPATQVYRKDWDKKTVVVWIHPQGQASLVQGGKLPLAVRRVLDRKAALLAVDVFRTGKFRGGKTEAVNKTYAGYTFGYNRPLLAERVHDILTAVALARTLPDVQKVELIGFDQAGLWVVLARALAGDAVQRTAADLKQFRFDQVKSTSDDRMLPGALKYGGLPALAALCAPHELYLHNVRGTGMGRWVKPAYQAAGKADAVQLHPTQMPADEVIDWLLP